MHHLRILQSQIKKFSLSPHTLEWSACVCLLKARKRNDNNNDKKKKTRASVRKKNNSVSNFPERSEPEENVRQTQRSWANCAHLLLEFMKKRGRAVHVSTNDSRN